jgi:5-formyltetrahydrofolate cyclo-ligase
LTARKKLTANEISQKSSIIIEKLKEYLNSFIYHSIAVYYPIHNEVDITPLYDFLWNESKNVLLPFSYKNGDMEFKLYEKDTKLISDDYGIPSPLSSSIFPKNLIDISLIPCVACDYSNSRLGYGAGFYDRFLDTNVTLSIGVCYSFQLIEKIPTTLTDKKLISVITD